MALSRSGRFNVSSRTPGRTSSASTVGRSAEGGAIGAYFHVPDRRPVAADEHAIATLQEAIGAAVPQRECIVWRGRRLTWADVTERTRRLANALLDAGVGGTVVHDADTPG